MHFIHRAQFSRLFIVLLFALAASSSYGSEEKNCASLLETKNVSFLNLAYGLFLAGDIHKLAEYLENNYGGQDFKITIPFSGKKIFLFQSRDKVTRVLKKRSKLPFVNKNFDVSHGHFSSINSVDTADQLWKDLHAELLDIFNHKEISSIMEKHKTLLIGKSEYNLNDALEEYFLKVWAEYCFGPVDHGEFTQLRNHLVETLGHVFHNNRWNRLPGIGLLTSQWSHFRYAPQLKAIDAGLSRLVRSAIEKKQGVFYELYVRLAPKHLNAFQITVDNAFLGCLVYDFIYIVMLDATTKIAQSPQTDRKQQVQKSIHDGFLYPFRFRTADEDFDEVQKGDYCIINLQKAGLYFSYGARACPGAHLFKEIYHKFLEIYSQHHIQLRNTDQKIQNTGNKDLPFMTSRHDVRILPQAKQKQLNFVLLGAPGAGKGTIAVQLKEKYKIPHISTGDIVRAEMDAGTPFGIKVKEMMNQGQLLPDTPEYMGQLFEAVKNRLAQEDCKNGFILDGLPRTGWQAEKLAEMLSSLDKKITAAVLLEVKRETLIQRLTGRLICKNCKLSYHKTFQPPKSPGTCDQCQQPLTERADDKEEVALHRLATYEAEIGPVLDYYGKEDLLFPLNGENSPQQLLETLSSSLEAKKKP